MFAHLFRAQTSLRHDVEAEVQSMCRARQIEELAAGHDASDVACCDHGSTSAVYRPTKHFW